ncbi:uncharacterized protein LY89DRAFT_393247 [Mollisia scopiformis]|uniref:Uncharacterized protein n=1 Tax=Mollisia scopiformis TaxID=149040 RepID=A0A194XPU1_MOLSC|nr:uncharacterized protein LY89DRAFT_393247 [Mollisia scopiformis]KUJ22074.1 hypothetical protein LY89DRAFT_393247 [Mollisia scopiformis]
MSYPTKMIKNNKSKENVKSIERERQHRLKRTSRDSVERERTEKMICQRKKNTASATASTIRNSKENASSEPRIHTHTHTLAASY